jgi:hypothetical protein
MEDIWARQGHDPRDADGMSGMIGEPADVHADDPLGDEAAFPSTWQQLAGVESIGRE